MGVIMTATPLDISALLANPKVGAVLHLGQPSVTVLGIGDLLYGDKSPAGRTIQTVYPAAYQDQISIFDFGMRPGPSPFARPDCTNHDVSKCARGVNPGRTYRFYTGTPVVPFGFGLSYTTFKYTIATQPAIAPLSIDPLYTLLSDSRIGGHPFVPARSVPSSWQASVQYAVNVTNTGGKDADDVVLGFLTPPGAGQYGIPLQTLFGFERVHVKAGETVTVWMYPAITDFAQASVDGRLTPLLGAYAVHFGVPETAAHGMGFVEAASLVAASEVSYVI